MREACQCQVIFDSERSMTKTKPSELANKLFDAGYSVDEVAAEFRDRFDVYNEEEVEEEK